MRDLLLAAKFPASLNSAVMPQTLTIEYSDDLLFDLGFSSEQFSHEAKFLLAAKLYEMGRVSSGQAARLAGKSRADFLLSLAQIGVAMSNLQTNDLQDELKFAFNE